MTVLLTSSGEHYVDVPLDGEDVKAAVAGGAEPLKKSSAEPGQQQPRTKRLVGDASTTACYKKPGFWLIGGLLVAVVVVGVSLGVILRGSGTKDTVSSSPAELGFEVVRTATLSDFNYTATLYRHVDTGAEVFSIQADDPNQAMGVVFRTPPNDNTGKPHVLEHSLLQGSDSYPVQHPGPFTRLSSGSTYTFMNAYTFPDRTLYPVSTASLQEFYNLAGVYLDAVFHPLFRSQEVLFRQEGWRYELTNASDPASLNIKGVVYNEMTGSFANPYQWLYHHISAELFPNTTYAFSSGGFPWEMPQLSYKDMQEFYGNFYHPTNARVYFYGSTPEAERLSMLSNALEGFERNPAAREDSAIRGAEPFSAPRVVELQYPSATTSGGAYVVSCWGMGSATEGVPTADEFALTVLSNLLLGSTSAPLYAALLASDLGSPITDGMVSGNSVQPVFIAGLENVAPGNASAVYSLVMGTLRDVREKGFSAEEVEAVVNTVLLAVKGAASESSQWGVNLLLSLASTWVYERDLVAAFEVSSQAEALMSRVRVGEDVFGPLIDEYFLDNAHQVELAMLPSAALARQQEDQAAAHLATTFAEMTVEEREALVAATAEFAEFQAAEDSAEAVASVPVLRASDLSREVMAVETEVVEVSGGGELLLHPQPTGGLMYARLAVSLDTLLDVDLPLLNLLGIALRQTGTEGETAKEFEHRIGLATGGVSISFRVLASWDAASVPVPVILLQGRSTSGMASNLTDIMADMLLRSGLHKNGTRAIVTPLLGSMVQVTSDALASDAMTTAWRRGEAMLGPVSWVEEQVSGLVQLEVLRRWQGVLLSDPAQGWPALRTALQGALSRALSGTRRVISLSANVDTLAAGRPAAERLLQELATLAPPAATPREWTSRLPLRTEALLIPTGNNHVTSSADLTSVEYSYSGASLAGAKVLGNWLFAQLRAERGAYGAFAGIDRRAIMTMATYRDPGLEGTLEVFAQAGQYLLDWAAEPDEVELNSAIISAVGDIDPFLPPSQRSLRALFWFVAGIPSAAQEERKAQLLAATAGDVAALGEAIRAGAFGRVVGTGAANVNATDANGEPLFQVTLPIDIDT